MGNQFVLGRIIAGPQRTTKTARIIETQQPARTEHYVNMIVQLRRGTRGQHPQTSGHAQMPDHRAALQPDQQILSPTLHIQNLLPR